MGERLEMRWVAWCFNCPWRYTGMEEHKADREANAHDRQWQKLGREHQVVVERVAFAAKFNPLTPPIRAPWEVEWLAKRNGSSLK